MIKVRVNQYKSIPVLIILFSILLSSSFLSCKHDPVLYQEKQIDNLVPNTDTVTFTINTQPCNAETVYFTNQILPIFISNCAISGCHDAESASDDVILTDYNTIRSEMKPGDPNDSEYYTVLLDTESDELMPRDPATGIGYSLPQEDLDLIRNWILQGALDNYCDECDTTEYSFSNTIFPIIETNCSTSSGCHGTGSLNSVLLSYEQIKPYADNGLIETRVISYKNMPPANPLPDCELFLIKKWIDNGAVNN